MSAGGVGRRPFAETAERVWSTVRVPDGEQFAVWREVVREAFVSVEVTRPRAGAFPSSVRSRRIGGVSISEIGSVAQRVARTSDEIVRERGDVFFLNLPLSHGTSARQESRTARLEPGDFVIVDSSRPFELDFSQQFQQVSLTIPHETLAPLLAAPSESTAVPVCGSWGMGAVASAAIRATAAGAGLLTRREERSLVEHLAGLIALAVGGVVAPPRSASRALLLQAAQDEIRRSHGDPDLAPGRVAERIGISTSYLHRLFADRGLSFGRSLMDRRLEQCRADLEDPSRRHWTISDIAFHHGFRDPSYFGRAFKLAHGATPKQYRARAAV